jgi:hypothetical protein
MRACPLSGLALRVAASTACYSVSVSVGQLVNVNVNVNVDSVSDLVGRHVRINH